MGNRNSKSIHANDAFYIGLSSATESSASPSASCSCSCACCAEERVERDRPHRHQLTFLEGLAQWVTPCCSGSQDESTTAWASRSSTASSRQVSRRRRRCRPRPVGTRSPVGSVDVSFNGTKHHAFWTLVQRILSLNDAFLMIHAVLDFLLTHMRASCSAVFLIDPNTSTMTRISTCHVSLSGIDCSAGIVGHVRMHKEPYCASDFDLSACYDRGIDLMQECEGQLLYCVPLLDENGNIYAVVEATTMPVGNSEAHQELELSMLHWLGPILNSCMRKCIEFHDVLLSERTQKALLHIISSSDTEDTVLNLVDGVIAGAAHIVRAERLSLFMIDWETEELWALSSSYHDENLRVRIHDSILGVAAKTQMTLTINDPKCDPRFHDKFDGRRGIDIRSALYVPVGVQPAKGNGPSRASAVLEILNKEDGSEFTFDDECAFEAFACEVAVILRRRGNEIEYIKLLADTRAEKVLAQRAKSQVNLLECYTSYSSTVKSSGRHGFAEHPLSHSFLKSHSRDCVVCSQHSDGDAHCIASTSNRRSSVTTPRVAYKFQSRPEGEMSCLSVTPGRIPSWDFNIFMTPTPALLQLVEDIFLDFNLDEILMTEKATMRNFIMATKEKYHPNPFHNFLHAVSVLHAAYLLLSTTSASEMLLPLDIAGCLIASFCHDVDHPGHTNAFEVSSGSQLALMYSDDSVLERHHVYTTFRILSKEKNTNILQNLSPADYRHVRKIIVTAILGTDMAHHFKFCESLEKMLHPSSHHLSTTSISSTKRDSKTMDRINSNLSNHGHSQSEIRSVLRDAVFQGEGALSGCGSANAASALHSPQNAAHRTMKRSSSTSATHARRQHGWVFNGTLDERIFLVKTIVHTSDLSGQVFPKPVALKWSNMITKEFAYQALLERAEGLSVSYQHLDDPLQMVEGQHFFAQKIVAPLWDLVYMMFPEVRVCIQNLAANITHYEQELIRLREAKEAGDSLKLAVADSRPPLGLSLPMTPVLEDEGVAVPGLARCTPAKFNSFRAILGNHKVSTESMNDTEHDDKERSKPSPSSNGDAAVTSSSSDSSPPSQLLVDIIEAATMSRVSSLQSRPRSSNGEIRKQGFDSDRHVLSSSDEEDEEDVQVLDVDHVYEASDSFFIPSSRKRKRGCSRRGLSSRSVVPKENEMQRSANARISG